MFTTIYTGMSGLIAFSKGLDVISNNVTNLNTPGFKGSDLMFRDVFYRYNALGGNAQQHSAEQLGSGVLGSGTSLRFAQGDIQDTENPQDAAIDGNGMFILRTDMGQQYTRAGQFAFDTDGYLVDRVTNARIGGLSGDNVVDINVSGLRINPAQATRQIIFHQNLSPGSTTHTINSVEVVDSVGEEHTWTLTFTNNNNVTPRSWLIDITEDGTTIASDLEIRFDGSGAPSVGYNQATFTFRPSGADAQEIVLNFGEPGGFDGATSFSAGTTSDLAVESQDGHVAGSLLDIEFESNGEITLTYSNGETASGGRLALAWFDDLQSLQQIAGGRFEAPAGMTVHIGGPTENLLGRIIGGSIEVSNVDLTREFTDLIIMQRGYQASSQVITASNEMLQQLMEIGK